MKTDPNDYAFSSPPASGSYGERGLTKREWFAGLAMQGLSSERKELTPAVADFAEACGNDTIAAWLDDSPENIATLSVKCADALIVKLNQDKKHYSDYDQQREAELNRETK